MSLASLVKHCEKLVAHGYGIRRDSQGRPEGVGCIEYSGFKADVHPDLKADIVSYFERLGDLGGILVALAASSRHASLSVEKAASTALVARGTRQYKLYRDDLGRLGGILTWNWLSQSSLERMRKTNDLSLHACEWNEGRILCFRDVAARPACGNLICDDLHSLFETQAAGCWVVLRSRSRDRDELVYFDGDQRVNLAEWMLQLFVKQ